MDGRVEIMTTTGAQTQRWVASALPLCVSLFHRLVLDAFSPRPWMDVIWHSSEFFCSAAFLNFFEFFFQEGGVVFEWSPTSSSPQARSLFPLALQRKMLSSETVVPSIRYSQGRYYIWITTEWHQIKNPTSRKSSASVFSSLRPSSLMYNLVENKTGEKNTIFLRWEQQRPRILFIWAKNQVSNHNATVSVH